MRGGNVKRLARLAVIALGVTAGGWIVAHGELFAGITVGLCVASLSQIGR